ncbi:hypothetical protein ACFQHW_10015 [Lapidilactobacillus achengensis]|uniref:Uncharacterized protein n=1 Tax=Lapidilactobacillus achengensis TaxID=2486000 RepID=A0ABW1UQB9_9LACO|nr:hypothetical protein [Lapidilactobacillus achengensis]
MNGVAEAGLLYALVAYRRRKQLRGARFKMQSAWFLSSGLTE